MSLRPISSWWGNGSPSQTMGSWSERTISHTGTETRSRLLTGGSSEDIAAMPERVTQRRRVEDEGPTGRKLLLWGIILAIGEIECTSKKEFTTRRAFILHAASLRHPFGHAQYSSLLPPVGVWDRSQFQCGWSSSQTSYPSLLVSRYLTNYLMGRSSSKGTLTALIPCYNACKEYHRALASILEVIPVL